MAESKKKYIIYQDWINTFDKLEDIEAGKLIKHLFKYINGIEEEAPDRLTNLLFQHIKQTIDRDTLKYKEVCDKNKENIKLRWNKNNTNEYDRINSNTKNTDSDNDSDNDNESDIDNDIKINKNKNIIDLSFVDFEYLESFELWLEYKKEKKQSYKSQKSLEICYRNLLKISNNDPEIASQIISNSIANNYSGLFPIKQNKEDQPHKFHNLINLYNQIQDEYANKPRTGKKFGEL